MLVLPHVFSFFPFCWAHEGHCEHHTDIGASSEEDQAAIYLSALENL